MNKLREVVLQKVKTLNESILDCLVLENYVSVKNLYKQRRKIVDIYHKYKGVENLC